MGVEYFNNNKLLLNILCVIFTHSNFIMLTKISAHRFHVPFFLSEKKAKKRVSGFSKEVISEYSFLIFFLLTLLLPIYFRLDYNTKNYINTDILI